jgi:hypothetical protein
MHAENLILYERGNGHGVEGISEGLPEAEGKLALTCIEIYLHSS